LVARNSIITLKLEWNLNLELIKLTMVTYINWLALIKAEENILIKVCTGKEFVTKMGLKQNVKWRISTRAGPVL
jgi:hypothetical protein